MLGPNANPYTPAVPVAPVAPPSSSPAQSSPAPGVAMTQQQTAEQTAGSLPSLSSNFQIAPRYVQQTTPQPLHPEPEVRLTVTRKRRSGVRKVQVEEEFESSEDDDDPYSERLVLGPTGGPQSRGLDSAVTTTNTAGLTAIAAAGTGGVTLVQGPDGKMIRHKRNRDVVYMADRGRRQITFSKRKSGLLKKAKDLSTLCGTPVFIVIVSEAQTVFTWASNRFIALQNSPAIQDCLERCLTGQSPNNMGEKMERKPQMQAIKSSPQQFSSPPPAGVGPVILMNGCAMPNPEERMIVPMIPVLGQQQLQLATSPMLGEADLRARPRLMTASQLESHYKVQSEIQEHLRMQQQLQQQLLVLQHQQQQQQQQLLQQGVALGFVPQPTVVFQQQMQPGPMGAPDQDNEGPAPPVKRRRDDV